MRTIINGSMVITDNVLGLKQLDKIESILREDLIKAGIHSVLLIDMAGNIIAKQDNGQVDHDLYSLAALASANFAAVDTMAKIVGEEEFSLLFHKGVSESTHFTKVSDEYLLISIFGSDVSLGLLRLKIAKAANKIKALCEQ